MEDLTRSPDLEAPELYLHRELSTLEFQARVLELARDPQVPLLERLRFMTIVSSNLDEFFEVRVASMMERVKLGVGRPGPDGLDHREALTRISAVVHELVDHQYRVLNEDLLPALAAQGIRLIKRSEWTEIQQDWIRRYFKQQVLPVLSPVALDTAHPFPNVQNKSLNFIITLQGKDAFGRNIEHAILKVPRALPRIIKLPESAGGEADFVMISSVIHENVGRLFPGMEAVACHQFRVTRNSNLWVDEEEVDDLRSALKGELHGRKYGAGVRLEVADNCKNATARFLAAKHNLDQQRDVYTVNGPVNLHRLGALVELVHRPELRYPPMAPSSPLPPKGDLFELLRERGSVLLHHPYESYHPVVDLVWAAARDPHVLAIKQTLYRTGSKSPVVEALVEAARSGKEVTAVIELRARFEEAANIRITTRLEAAGASVVYGVVGHKCHAKMLLIVRREGKKLRRYAHLGTGNYHTGTARAYTDYSLLTSDSAVGEDVHALFMGLTGLGKVPKTRKLLHSPFTLKKRILHAIEQETENAREGREAWIKAKCNALTDPGVIQALYRASQAGVQVDLVIRSICCLRPGVPGVSENIRVRSIVGRFLEHTRVFCFANSGQPEVYCSSADWMTRNLERRVEACFPIEEPTQSLRVMKELDLYQRDATGWELQTDGTYRRSKRRGASAQETLLSRYAR